jgi:hypothetical protein
MKLGDWYGSGPVRRFPGGGIIEIGVCRRKYGETAFCDGYRMAETARAGYDHGITKRAIRTALGVSITALRRLWTMVLSFAGLFAAGHSGMFWDLDGVRFHTHGRGYQLR